MPAILIERLLRHPGGTHISLPNLNGGPDTEYFFAPDAQGREYCTVEDERHQSILLAITEGFRFAGAAVDFKPVPASIATAATSAPAATLGAPEATPPVVLEEPQPAADAFDPKATIDAEALANWAEASEANEAALRKMHEAELGAAPRQNARVDTIAAKIAAKRAVA